MKIPPSIQILTGIGLLFSLWGCQRPKPLKPTQEEITPTIDLEKGVFIDRSDNLSSATISFSSFNKSHCEIHYWTQDQTQTPNKENPAIIKCPNDDKGRTEFTVNVEKLSTNALYYFEIYVWESNKSFQQSFYIPIKEVYGGSTVYGEVPQEVKNNRFIVAKADLSNGVAFIQEKQSEKGLADQSLSDLVKIPVAGCTKQDQEILDNNFKSVNLKIRNLSTRGFAESSDSAITELELMTVELNSHYQIADRWEWGFMYNSQDYKISVKTPPTFLSSIKVEHSDVKILDKKGFDDQLVEMDFDPSKNITINWTYNEPQEASYIKVRLIDEFSKTRLVCYTDSKTKKLEISSEDIKDISAKNIQLYISAEQTVLIEKQPIHWLISTSDWRVMYLKS